MNRWSFVVGVVAILSALPTVAQIVQRYRTSGTLQYPALCRLIAVPLLFIVTRYAERRM